MYRKETIGDTARRTTAKAIALHLALLGSPLALALAPLEAVANCVTTGATTTCDATTPNPYGSRVGAADAADLVNQDGRTVIVNGGSIVVGNSAAISLRDNANIHITGNALLQNAATADDGLYNAGNNVIEFRNGSTLVIDAGSQVIATGNEIHGEAVNAIGIDNVIINNGLIQANFAAALWFEAMDGRNTVINNGTIQANGPGIASVIGSGDGIVAGASTIDFTNRGAVIGNLIFGTGDDILRLYPGQTISGSLDGNAGFDQLFLSGTGSDAIAGTFPGFEELIKNESGTWTITGAIAGPTAVIVDGGTLIIAGDNSAYAGSVTVNAAGVLQGRAQVLPQLIADNGLVRFAQTDDGTYAGLLTGTGAVEKTGAGVLVLAPATAGGNTYAGGTTITEGVLAIAADNAIGAATGPLTFNGGTLRFNTGFNLSAQRAIAITAAGGTIDTNTQTTTIAQGITGAGALAVTGGGSLILAGDSTYAGGTSIATGTRLQLGTGGNSGSILGDVANAGILAFNRADTLAFAGAVSGTGEVHQDGPGTTVLSGANTYSGATRVNAGILRAGGAGVFSAASAHSVAAGATLDLAGFDQTVAGLTNAGLVSLGGAPGTRLTVNGNYVGQGGLVALNTHLGGDGSPSDRLVINGGTATGDTRLRITNVGGEGARTVADGIQVVEVANGGATANGAFRLDTRVTAGAYEYQLFRGGSSSPDDWYLRSFGGPAIPGDPGSPGDPGIPLFRPEAALYAPIPAIARQMGLATLGTLHERVGEEENIRDLTGRSPYANGAWARAFGERTRNRWDGTVDAAATGNLIGLQAGFDILRTNPYAGGHRDHAGVYVAYTDYNAPDVSGFALGQRDLRVGRLLMSGPAVGAYWTHFGPSGWYVDAVFQANWFDVTAVSDFDGRLNTSGTGYAASLEAGYPIRFGGNWQIEPQAQVIWQTVSVDGVSDPLSTTGTRIGWDEGDAVTGRIGARLQYTGRDERTVWQPYAKVNLWHAFAGTDRVAFDGSAPVENRFGDTAIEVGAGITARVSRTTSFYAHADYRVSVGGGRSEQSATQGSIGIRINW